MGMEPSGMNVNVDLPPDLAEFVREEAVAYGDAGAEAFIQRLVSDALRAKEKDRLVGLLLEGIGSPMSDITADDWDELRALAVGGQVTPSE